MHRFESCMHANAHESTHPVPELLNATRRVLHNPCNKAEQRLPQYVLAPVLASAHGSLHEDLLDGVNLED